MISTMHKFMSVCSKFSIVKNLTQRSFPSATYPSYSNINSDGFEKVFSFPLVKYFAIFNRLKVYHFIGCSIAVPSSGILEMLEVWPDKTFFCAAYVGITAGALLSLASLPARNIIGFIYINESGTKIKISSVDYWGKRKDKIVSVNDWIPLLDLPPKMLDTLYLSPQLIDGTKYKFFVRFGQVHNAPKMGQVLD